MTVLFGVAGQCGKQQIYPLLALAAAQHWKLSPLPAIQRAEHGKPFFPTQPELYFSLSHSGGMALCALSDHPVGVDIELVRPRRASLPRFCLAPGELAWFHSHGGTWPAFYTLWTRKESLCKYTGRGLTFPINQIAVPLPPDPAVGDLTITSYGTHEWQASLCCTGQPPEDILWFPPE